MGRVIKAVFLLCAAVVAIGGVLFLSREFFSPSTVKEQIFNQQSDRITKVMRRGAFESQARKYAKAGDLDKAIDLYQKAIQPELINEPHEQSTAVGAMVEIYKWQQKYAEASKTQAWFMRHKQPSEVALEERNEVDALLQFQKTKSISPVIQHIELIKSKYKGWLPPRGYSVGAAIHITDILRLYDTIGDYDAGIAYIDECLAYFKTQDIQKYGAYRPGKADAEYLKIRKAFEREKANGGPACGKWGKIESPAPNEPDYCIGDATQALIQSNYFPW